MIEGLLSMMLVDVAILKESSLIKQNISEET